MFCRILHREWNESTIANIIPMLICFPTFFIFLYQCTKWYILNACLRPQRQYKYCSAGTGTQVYGNDIIASYPYPHRLYLLSTVRVFYTYLPVLCSGKLLTIDFKVQFLYEWFFGKNFYCGQTLAFEKHFPAVYKMYIFVPTDPMLSH